NIGGAFVDRHGSGVYFAYPSLSGDVQEEGRVIELTKPIRGKLRDFLFNEQDEARAVIFERVLCRVREDMRLECHVDTDEANAAGLKNGTQVRIV
ncbi:MAG: PduL/EutD family phosphate acyltransferase, partial [bacterium]